MGNKCDSCGKGEYSVGILWFNGPIYTMNQSGETIEAVVTMGGKIIDVGSLAQIEKEHNDIITERIDLAGRTMLPGFTDSHMHLIGYGETFLRLDLTQVKSKQQLLDMVRQQAAIIPAGEWIIAEGFNENVWSDKTLPTATELSEVSSHHPILLKRACRHLVICNLLALQRANITAETMIGTDGVIEKDSHGNPTGVLKEGAIDLVFDVLPETDQHYLENALKIAIQQCWRRGLVGAHTEDLSYYGSYERTYETFQRVIQQQGWKFRSHLLIHQQVIDDWKRDGHAFLSGDEFLQFGAMKIFIDGTIGGRTALLTAPYADDPTTTGVAIHSQEELEQLVKKARAYKLPIATHVIGDLAFDMVLDLIAKYPPPSGTRDRLIHAQILRKDLITKAKKLAVVLDIQPQFTVSDFPWVIKRLGQERVNESYVWKTLLNEGIHCAGGSDAPIEAVDPLLGIHAAVTRTKLDDPHQIVYGKNQCLSVFEAVSLYTTGAAYAANQEQMHGQIKQDFVADFTILSDDVFRIDSHDILKTNVEMTVVDGLVVYDRSKE